MISKEQMELYIRLDGDVDRYQRLRRRFTEDEALAHDDWRVIDDLYQRLVIRKNNRESESYAKQTDILLTENIPSQEVQDMFRNYCLGIKEQKAWWKFW